MFIKISDPINVPVSDWVVISYWLNQPKLTDFETDVQNDYLFMRHVGT